MSSQVIPLDARDDPCADARCDANSFCVVKNDVAKCVCQPGHNDAGNDAGICVDIDECSSGLHDCSKNADCYNTAGSFDCVCKQGYNGNGVDCQGESVILCSFSKALKCHNFI